MTSLVAVPSPAWQLKYRGVAIKGRIEKMVVSIEYTSFEGGASPDLEITLEDRDQRWQGPWFPQRGDQVDLSIGYSNSDLVSCGTFQVDEVELDLPPDQVKMKCLAITITPDARTPNSQAYETVTLGAIAKIIADKHGWTLVTAPEAINIEFERVTQTQETNVEFLHRLARENNYDFTVKGGQVIFYSRTALESLAAIMTFRRGDVVRGNFKAKTLPTYKAATVSYQEPRHEGAHHGIGGCESACRRGRYAAAPDAMRECARRDAEGESGAARSQHADRHRHAEYSRPDGADGPTCRG